jgi:hypothetical protein
LAKFDWDRETREARKRAHGSIPVWADPSALSFDDERELRRRLTPLTDLVEEFASLSTTHRRQRGSEVIYQGGRLRRQAVDDAQDLPNRAVRESIAGWGDLLVDRLKELATGRR